jgi:hypothetical protein
LVSKSIDGGETWGQPKVIASGPEGNSFNDKEAITADPRDPKFAYLTWTRFTSPNSQAADSAYASARAVRGGLAFSRTTDGGATWEPARMIFESMNALPSFSQIVVLPDGDLLNVFQQAKLPYSKPNWNGAEHSLSVNITRSSDRGLTWTRPLDINPGGVNGTSDPESGELVRSGGLDVAVDSVSGKVSIAWTYAFPGSAVDGIALSTSEDGGRTWSAPMKVNRTPSNIDVRNQQVFNPSVATTANGTSAVSYYDLRANDSDQELWTSMHVALCPPVANCADPSSWNEQTLTDQPFDMRQAPFASGYFVGDYVGLVAAGDHVVAAFSMPHSSDPASLFVRSVEVGH